MITSPTSSGSDVKGGQDEGEHVSIDDVLGLSPADAHVGQRLSELLSILQTAYVEERDRCGLLHREVARRLGTDPSEISHILSGRRNISVKKLAYLLHAMNRDFLVQAPPLSNTTRQGDNVALATDAPAKTIVSKQSPETMTLGRSAAFGGK